MLILMKIKYNKFLQISNNEIDFLLEKFDTTMANLQSNNFVSGDIRIAA